MKTVPIEMISPAQYARSRGLSRNTVCKQIRHGKISAPNGFLDPTVADQERARNLRPSRVIEAARRKASSPKPTVVAPSSDLRRAFAEGQQDAIKRIVAGFQRLPRALVDLGLSVEQAYGAAIAFGCILWDGVGERSNDYRIVRLGWPVRSRFRRPRTVVRLRAS